ncbi:hypothetical protein AB1Y20_005858 [Prymnesium parvum]|uniref:TauD/TfdA-like domain-containing protein n=1 Tax=Prymnesium parvum TaxID=97485 RepID=A0AB34J006_PRYPA
MLPRLLRLPSTAPPRRPPSRRLSSTARPLTPSFGSEVSGVDLSQLLRRPASLAEYISLVYRRGVVVFREQQHLTPHEELAFARAFNHQPDPPGETSYTGGAAPQAKLPPPLEDIAVIGTFRLAEYHGFTGESAGVYPPWPKGQLAWHMDGLADTVPPPDLTTMRCIATPREGGETIFRCARRPASRLQRVRVGGADVDPELVRIRYKLPKQSRLRASGYSLDWAAGGREDDAEVNMAAGTEWPLLIREPITGQRSLLSTYHVASGLVLDERGHVAHELDFDQANELVENVWALPGADGATFSGLNGSKAEEVAAPGFADDARCMAAYQQERVLEAKDEVILHQWRVGDLVAWSNRLVIHSATSTKLYAPGATRIHHRIRLRSADNHKPSAWREHPHALYERMRDATSNH